MYYNLLKLLVHSPIFKMPNPGHVDVERLEQIKQYGDLREEEGWYKDF
jgi:hypothetical protein